MPSILLPLALITTLLADADAAEMIMSPGGVTIEGFDGDEQVIWTDWGWECSCQVLDIPGEAELPVQIDAVRIGLGSAGKRFDHDATSVAVGLQRLGDGEAPTKLPGVTEWDWPEVWFNVAISSDHLSEIPMENLYPPTWPIKLAGGRLAVFVCGADPDLAFAWPMDEETGDAAGLIIDPDLPGDDSYLWVYPMMLSLSDLGIDGGYVIQAVASDARADVSGFSLMGIDPASTELGVVADVTVQGEGFADGMELSIGGLAVADLTIVDEATATGRSPSGLPVGSHDVRAVSVDGDESLLTTAFEITEPPADGGAEGDGGAAGGPDGGAEADGGSTDSSGGSATGCGGCSQGGQPGSGGLLVSLTLFGAGMVGLRRRRHRCQPGDGRPRR